MCTVLVNRSLQWDALVFWAKSTFKWGRKQIKKATCCTSNVSTFLGCYPEVMENGLICQTKHFLLHVISRNCPNLVSSWASDRNRQLAGDQPRWAGIGLLWKYKIHNTKIQKYKIQLSIRQEQTAGWGSTQMGRNWTIMEIKNTKIQNTNRNHFESVS